GTNARTLAAAAAAPKAVWPCLGFHPEAPALTDEDLARVEAQVAEHHSRIVALGEIGLPWYSLEGAVDAAALMARGRERLHRLLGALRVESDGPWTYRGEFEGLPSGPWFASRVAEEVAKLKQMPVEDVMHQLSTNACSLFDLVWA